MSIKKRVAKDAFFYSIAYLISQGLLIFKNCLVANILAPANFGFWKFLQLLSEYGTSGSIVIIEGLRQKIPIYTAKGQERNVRHIRDVAFTFSVILSVFYFIASFVIYLFIFNADFIRSKGFPGNSLPYLASINILIILTIIYTFLWRYLSTINRFSEVSKIKIVVAIIDFALSIYLAYKFKVAGLIIAVLITYFIAAFIISKKEEFRPSFTWDIEEALNLVYLGLPLFVIGFVYQLLTSIDRIMIVRFLDNKQLGLYGIALITFNMFSLLSLPSSHVVYPRMIEEFSSSGFKINENFRKYTLLPVEILSYLIPPAIIIVYFFLPLIMAKFLPLYASGIKTIIILVIGAFFLNLMGIFSFAVITLRKFKAYLIIYTIVILVNLFLTFTLVKNGYGIEGVALASSISYAILTTIVIYYILNLFKFSLFNKTSLIARLYFPLLFSLCAFILIDKFIANFMPRGNWFFAVIGLAIYCALYLLFIYFYSRKSKIILDLKWLIKENALWEH